MQDLFFEGKREEAIAAVPEEFADEISLVGLAVAHPRTVGGVAREPRDHVAGGRARRRAAEGDPRPGAGLSGPMTNVTVDNVAPHVKQITLNRPERLNALNFELAADLHDALDAVGADAECRVAILTGAGRGFCSGLDLKDFGTPPAPGRASARPRRDRRPGVHGQPHGAHAVDAADHRRRGERRRVRRWARDRSRRRSPDRGRVGHLLFRVHPHRSHRHRHRRELHAPRLLGASRAFDLIVTGRTIDAVEAEHLGLVTRVVPDDTLLDEAIALASQIAAYTAVGLRMTKEVMWANLDAPNMSAALALENRNQTIAGRSPEVQAYMDAYMAPAGSETPRGGYPASQLSDPWEGHDGPSSVPRRRDLRRVQHAAGARARGSRLALDHVRRRRSARSTTPALTIRDIDGVDRRVRQRLRVPGPARARCGARCRASASRRSSRRPARSPAGSGHHRAHRARDRPASTPTARRPRRGPVRRTSSSRRSACSPPPSSRSWPVATCTSTARQPEALATVAAADPQQRARQPRGRLLRARAVHAPRTSSTAGWSPTRSTSSTAR